jgi:protease I
MGVLMAAVHKKIAFIATDYFEEVELTEPMRDLQEAGATVEVLAPHEGTIQALQHIKPGKSVKVTKTISGADPADYDAVILPGGVVNADKIRMDESARRFVHELLQTGKLVGAICHAPWLLVSAGLVRGKRLTSYYTLQDDIRNAGGDWQDKEVVVDGTLITSRKPDDIPAFNRAIRLALGL